MVGFGLVVAAVSLLATWVGLSGTWVGDDWHMVDNYLYADWAELGAVFKRNAAYYLFTDDKVGPYRPITMLTLLGTHLLVPEPWLHHATSWLLHVATTVLLFAALRRQFLEDVDPAGKRGATTVAALLSALFFLHPVHAEAYVWINGRSDLLAGFWLAAMVFWLSEASDDSSDRALPVILVALMGFLGAGSKLPFVIAAAVAWLAWSLRERPARRRAYGVAIAVGVAVHAVLRASFAPFRDLVGDVVSFDVGVWRALPKLFVHGMAALLSLRAEAMQSLSWVLFGPWTPLHGFSLVLLVLVAAWFVWCRDWPGLVYFSGAFLTLAPVVVVSRSFWMGFDRYLYMPAILLVLAAAPHALGAWQRAPERARRVIVLLCAIVLLFSAFQLHRASEAYADQRAYETALLADHPEDPTIHYYFARAADRSGDVDALRDRLAAMPSPSWPRPIIVPTYELASKAGHVEKASEAIAAFVATRDEGASCIAVREQLERWKARAPASAIDARLTSALEAIDCGP
jgi:hypothetical protein